MEIAANRCVVLLLLLGAASVSYVVGFIAGFWLLLAVGVIFELAFWVKLFERKRRH